MYNRHLRDAKYHLQERQDGCVSHAHHDVPQEPEHKTQRHQNLSRQADIFFFEIAVAMFIPRFLYLLL